MREFFTRIYVDPESVDAVADKLEFVGAEVTARGADHVNVWIPETEKGWGLLAPIFALEDAGILPPDAPHEGILGVGEAAFRLVKAPDGWLAIEPGSPGWVVAGPCPSPRDAARDARKWSG